MTTLTFEAFKIPGAGLGEESGLPDMKNNTYISSKINVSETLTEEEARYIGKGMLDTVLPYTDQNQYDRSRRELTLHAAVLENECLKATFIPELGGRLWSLYDKIHRKELLYANTCFQPGNLGIRNAWFSGGVEWNVGIKGHTPLTCSPLFAAEKRSADGETILCMYEYERKRKVVYSISATLSGELLLVRNTIENRRSEDTYMYWWSNIAVPETPKTRVVVPARSAFIASYARGSYELGSVETPVVDGIDISYADRLQRCRDFFYKIPKEEEKWVAAVDEAGEGLLEFSTSELQGRKMFAWGQKRGGRHWNRWLSDSGRPYIEIQAGLLKTQMEHFIMPGNSEISFVEAYTHYLGDPEILHGENYDKAIAEVKKAVLPRMNRLKKSLFENTSDEHIVQFGQGYGALEEAVRGKRLSRFCVFPQESLGENQRYWMSLLRGEDFTPPEPLKPIVSYSDRLEWIGSIEAKKEQTWYDAYQLGVLYYQKGDMKKAKESFLLSSLKEKNPWALRCLAQLAYSEENAPDEALDFMEEALRMKNDHLALAVDAGELLLKCRAYARFEGWYSLMDEKNRRNGRVNLQRALCLAKTGHKAEAEAIVTGLTVDDMKEGEYTLSDLWAEIHSDRKVSPDSADTVFERYPLPEALDFRMH